jgi:MFS family permease
MLTLNKKNRFLFLAIVCLGMTGLFGVPYMTRGFYNVFQDAMGITNAQIGLLMSTFGLISLVLYFVGGWITDKVGMKKLLVYSYIASGFLGMAMLKTTSITGLVWVYAGFAVANGPFYPAMLKFIRALGDDSEQGLFYGLKEAGYAVVGVIVGFIVVRINISSGSDALTFRWLVILYSGISVTAGILLAILMKEPESSGESDKIDMTLVRKLIKTKEVWLITITIFCCYLIYSSLTYSSPYLVDVYGINNATASSLGLFRQYVASSFVCLAYGLIADKIGSHVKLINITFFGLIASCAAFAFMPQGAGFVTLAIALMVIITVLACGVRGVYFAQVSEAGIPLAHTGTVLGIISILAFTPDAFYFSAMGGMLDRYIAAGDAAGGYSIIFAISAVAAVVGAIATGILYKTIREKRANKEIKSA